MPYIAFFLVIFIGSGYDVMSYTFLISSVTHRIIEHVGVDSVGEEITQPQAYNFA